MKIITGVVQEGKKMARTLGFPTANIACPLGLNEGVYAAITQLSTDSKKWRSLAYLKDGILEVYLIDADLDLYGSTITVQLTKFIRSPIPFTTAEAMQAQIQQDLLFM